MAIKLRIQKLRFSSYELSLNGGITVPYITQKLTLFSPDVSIIDYGAKHNPPLYVMIAKAFQIPYLVVHDENPLLNQIPLEWNKDKRRKKEVTFGINDEIAQLVDAPLGKIKVFLPDFEGSCGVSKSQEGKKGKALAAVKHFEKTPLEKLSEVHRVVTQRCYSIET